MRRRVAVYAATRNMYRQMAASAKSLLRHTRMDRVYFLIEDDAFPEELPDVIQTMNMVGQTYFPMDGANSFQPWSYMELLRVALPDILCQERYVLWLDVDTIVERDIGELFDADIGDDYAAMVPEPDRCQFPSTYYNSGVVLMNVMRMRKDGVHWLMIDWLNRVKATAPGQDALNLFCQAEITPLGPEWNCAPGITGDAENPYIRHYAGYLKPRGTEAFGEYVDAEWIVKEDK